MNATQQFLHAHPTGRRGALQAQPDSEPYRPVSPMGGAGQFRRPYEHSQSSLPPLHRPATTQLHNTSGNAPYVPQQLAPASSADRLLQQLQQPTRQQEHTRHLQQRASFLYDADDECADALTRHQEMPVPAAQDIMEKDGSQGDMQLSKQFLQREQLSLSNWEDELYCRQIELQMKEKALHDREQQRQISDDEHAARAKADAAHTQTKQQASLPSSRQPELRRGGIVQPPQPLKPKV